MDEQLAATSRVEATHFWFRGFREFVTPVIEQAAGGRRSLRLVDCGCGTGHNLALLKPYGRAVGFDLTPAALSFARRSGWPIARADITQIPFAAGTFDVLTSYDVLQAVEDDLAAMREVARVLRPGGVAIVSAAALRVLRGGHAALWPEFRRYTRASVTQLVERSGLKVERVQYLFGSLFPMMLAVRGLQRLMPQQAVEQDWEMNVPAAPVNGALTWMLRAEAAITRRVPLAPAGSSVLLVARKPRT